MTRKMIALLPLFMAGPLFLLLPGCDMSCFGKESYCISDSEEEKMWDNYRKAQEIDRQIEESHRACRERLRRDPDSFIVDPFGLAGRPSSEWARLHLAAEDGIGFVLSDLGKPESKLWDTAPSKNYRIHSVAGKEVFLRARKKTQSSDQGIYYGCANNAMYVPVGQVEVVFRLSTEEGSRLSFTLTAKPGEDIYLATYGIVASLKSEGLLTARVDYLANLVVASVGRAPVALAGSSETPADFILGDWIVGSSTWPALKGMVWGEEGRGEWATGFIKDIFHEALSPQLSGARAFGDLNMNFDALPAAKFETRRRELVDRSYRAVNAGLAAGQPGDTRNFRYPGQYVLTRGDQCVEDAVAPRTRFLDIAREPAEGAPQYFVSYGGGFLLDDDKAFTWNEKLQPDGSLQSIIEEPVPASPETNNRPMIAQHRMTLKPLNANHLTITQWTRTDFDSETKAVQKTVDMMARPAGPAEHDYRAHLGSRGYCLLRVQQPLQ